MAKKIMFNVLGFEEKHGMNVNSNINDDQGTWVVGTPQHMKIVKLKK